MKDRTFNANPFTELDAEEAQQEINLIHMDNNEEKLVDIEWKSSISSKKIVSSLLI